MAVPSYDVLEEQVRLGRLRDRQHRDLFARGPRQVVLPEPEWRPAPPLRQDEQAALMGEIPGAESRRPTVKHRRER